MWVCLLSPAAHLHHSESLPGPGSTLIGLSRVRSSERFSRAGTNRGGGVEHGKVSFSLVLHVFVYILPLLPCCERESEREKEREREREREREEEEEN